MDLNSLAENYRRDCRSSRRVLNGVAGGMAELNTIFAAAYGALDSAMDDIPGTSISQEELQALYGQTIPANNGLGSIKQRIIPQRWPRKALMTM
jgi:hypothetical protein